MKNLLKIGISGGTFDPIHNGHLIMAETIREWFGLDKVLFIPSGNPPHKNNLKVTQGIHRLNMVANAIASNSYFEALNIEVDREGYTYSVDTLTQLNEIYGNNAVFYFIVGADVIFDLLTWKSVEKVFKMCQFIAVMRSGYNEVKFNERVRYLQEVYSAVIHTARMPAIEISSTIIREKVSNNKSIKYLVPENVEQYIIKEGLYKEKSL